MEAVKNRFSRASCGTPGPSSSTRMRTSSPTRVAATSTRPPGGEKLTALSMMLSIARASRSGFAHAPTAASLRGRAKARRASPFSRRFSQDVDELLDQRAEVDRLERRAGEFGIGPRGLADVADQSVEPDDVVAHDRHQLLAQLRILDPVEAVDRRAQGRERVLELVSDVGGEMLRYCRSAGAATGSCPRPPGRAGRSRRCARAGEAP